MFSLFEIENLRCTPSNQPFRVAGHAMWTAVAFGRQCRLADFYVNNFIWQYKIKTVKTSMHVVQ
uniref:Uncharacterized protein n=1 Tax=Romanomermis culicivorax TaxID=13658 RepID=A0A915ISW1_ROMCU